MNNLTKERKNNIIGSSQLFLTAVIWGVAFVAQSEGSELLEANTFNFLRNAMGVLFLITVIPILRRKSTGGEARTITAAVKGPDGKTLILGGICCGVMLFGGMTTQQIGLAYTTVGKAGFITAMYILFVPVIGLFLGERHGAKLWFGVALAIVGLYMLCVKESVVINKGDILMVCSAIIYSVQILLVDYFSRKVDGVWLSCLQCTAAAMISMSCMIAFESPRIENIIAAWMPLLYTGILSSGVAYTMQITGQSKVKPTIASLIMSLESVISAIAGWILLGQRLSPVEITGCAFIFIAVILAQLPQRRFESEQEPAAAEYSSDENI